MAIDALLVRNGGFEIACLMAALAGHSLVSAKERKGGLRMVEPFREAHLFPGSRVVAGLTGILERAVMWIGVTIGALGECDPDVFHIRLRRSYCAVTFFACDACVSAGQ